MRELSLRGLVGKYITDSYELGARLPMAEDAGWYQHMPRLPSGKAFTAFGAGKGSTGLRWSEIIGSPAFTIQKGKTNNEIARLRPFNPGIPPMAAFYQFGPDGTAIAISPGRTLANKIDKIFISFQTVSRHQEELTMRGDAWIAISTAGKIEDTSLPPGFDKEKLAQRARALLQDIREGKSVTQKNLDSQVCRMEKTANSDKQQRVNILYIYIKTARRVSHATIIL